MVRSSNDHVSCNISDFVQSNDENALCCLNTTKLLHGAGTTNRLRVELPKSKKHDEDQRDTTSLGEYIIRAMNTFVERPEFKVGGKVMLKVRNLFHRSFKPKRRWYEPFKVNKNCKGNSIEIWDDALGFIKVESLELRIMDEDESEEKKLKSQP